MTIHLYGGLTRKVNPGDVIHVGGIFLPTPYTGFRAMRAGLLQDTYLEAQNIHQLKKQYSAMELTPEIEANIINAFALIVAAAPVKGGLFRRMREGNHRGGQFSPSLFDIVATGVYCNIDTLNVENVYKGYRSLINSPQLEEVAGAGSNTKKKFEGRVKLGKEIFDAGAF